jgi:aldehyde:ferredoxin oxidoreductase
MTGDASTRRATADDDRRQAGSGPLRGLCIDVGTAETWYEELSAQLARAVIGGRGLGAYLALRARAYEIDALAAGNPLVFAAGPLTGRDLPAARRYSITARSPLTGTVFDGNSGGEFGSRMKAIGLDFVLLTGASESPVRVVIGRTGAHLLPAADLWGMDVPSTLGQIGVLHPGGQAAVIGPAAENGVLFASIVNNRGRQAGRGGLGAVMGAKKVKAVVLEATAPRRVTADKKLRAVVDEARVALRESPITSRALPEYGTAVLVNVLNQAGALPTRNFRESRFELAEGISGEKIRESFPQTPGGCRGCPVGCSRRIDVGGEKGRGPQYETVWALGADCGVADLRSVAAAGFACDRAGLDTITMGATIASAMELTELGLLVGGPRFGDADALAPLVEATAQRRGLGDELAEGSRRFAARHGRPDLAMHVKGLELPAFDPRGMTGQGLAFATSNRGACHVRANMLGPEILGVPEIIDRFATRGKAAVLARLQDSNAVLDSLVMCKFTSFVLQQDYFARLLSAAVGEDWSVSDLLLAGERIWTLEKTFNRRAGMGRADDTLPARLLQEPVAEGPAAGRVVDLEPMLDEYYAVRGWSRDGDPSADKLAQLGLSPEGELVRVRDADDRQEEAVS